MFGKEYSPISARMLRDDQSRVLRENRERREASGLTLREQRAQEYAQQLEEEREASADAEVEAVESSEVLPPPEPVSSDPLGHLRAARLGFAAVVVLVIYWLWIRRQRA